MEERGRYKKLCQELSRGRERRGGDWVKSTNMSEGLPPQKIKVGEGLQAEEDQKRKMGVNKH